MTQAIISGPLVSLALPKSGVARFLSEACVVVGGTLLLVASAKTKVFLGPVDISLQTMVVMLLASTLGMRLGVATVVAYMVQGAMGMPVFQGTPEKGIGLAYMVGPTGGYLLGFVVAAAIVGYAADRGWDRNVVKVFAAMMVAEVVLLALGAGWLAVLIGAENAWKFGVMPFIVPDLIKTAFAALMLPAGWSVLRFFKR